MKQCRGTLSACSVNGLQSQGLKGFLEKGAWGAKLMPDLPSGKLHMGSGRWSLTQGHQFVASGKQFSPYQWTCLSRQGSD